MLSMHADIDERLFKKERLGMCLQGLNIAPALISIVPVKTVVNPTGPLSISDSLISVEVPSPGR